jgi:hypothetical protein
MIGDNQIINYVEETIELLKQILASIQVTNQILVQRLPENKTICTSCVHYQHCQECCVNTFNKVTCPDFYKIKEQS